MGRQARRLAKRQRGGPRTHDGEEDQCQVSHSVLDRVLVQGGAEEQGANAQGHNANLESPVQQLTRVGCNQPL